MKYPTRYATGTMGNPSITARIHFQAGYMCNTLSGRLLSELMPWNAGSSFSIFEVLATKNPEIIKTVASKRRTMMKTRRRTWDLHCGTKNKWRPHSPEIKRFRIYLGMYLSLSSQPIASMTLPCYNIEEFVFLFIGIYISMPVKKNTNPVC